MLYGELTVMAIWLVLLVASSRSRRDPVGTLLLATAPVVLALFEVVDQAVLRTTQYSASFSALRLPFFRVPVAVLLGGAAYVYCVRELIRSLVQSTSRIRALSWLPAELRYLLFVGMLTTTGWVLEWMGDRLGLWQLSPAPAWNEPFLTATYRYYLLFILSSILYAGALAWLLKAPTGEGRQPERAR